jgi:hypothetical protein
MAATADVPSIITGIVPHTCTLNPLSLSMLRISADTPLLRGQGRSRLSKNSLTGFYAAKGNQYPERHVDPPNRIPNIPLVLFCTNRPVVNPNNRHGPHQESNAYTHHPFGSSSGTHQGQPVPTVHPSHVNHWSRVERSSREISHPFIHKRKCIGIVGDGDVGWC